jgi:hypothetical protein
VLAVSDLLLGEGRERIDDDSLLLAGQALGAVAAAALAV